MKKFLYGLLFFIIGLGFFILSWISILLFNLLFVYIIVIDILLLFFALYLYNLLRKKYTEKYQRVMLYIFLCILPLVLNLIITSISWYTACFVPNKMDFEDTVGYLIWCFLCLKSFLFSLIFCICYKKKV